jgi:hypothetical protein
MHEVVCYFPNPWAITVGWVVIPQNVKKIQKHYTLLGNTLSFLDRIRI